MKKPSRLYIVTGKGGVGKSIISLSLTKYLCQKNINACYTYFQKNSLLKEDKPVSMGESIAQDLNIPSLGLSLENCAHNYMTKKLRSSLISKAIIKTPFFRSLINMLPGFGYLIYLGQVLQSIQDSNDGLTIVLDSPSSGHVLTMLESVKNFQNIFGSGAIFDDTQKMLELLNQNNFAKINILSIPTQLSFSEAKELKLDLEKVSNISSEIYFNNTMGHLFNSEKEELPSFLKKKMAIEREITSDQTSIFQVPFILKEGNEEIVEDLLPYMENLV